MRIIKNICPRLCEYRSLGGCSTEEGYEYLEKYEREIEDERYNNMNLNLNRAVNFGGDEKIHMPETVQNPLPLFMNKE